MFAPIVLKRGGFELTLPQRPVVSPGSVHPSQRKHGFGILQEFLSTVSPIQGEEDDPTSGVITSFVDYSVPTSVKEFETGDWNQSSEELPVCSACGCMEKDCLELNIREGSYACIRCGAVCKRSFISMHREKFCEEEEDATVRADVAWHERDMFSGPPETADEARKRRWSEGGTFFSGKRQKGHVREAQSLVRREAASSLQKASILQSKGDKKLRAVMVGVEAVYEQIGSANDLLKRACRVAANEVIVRGFSHAAKCKHDCNIDIVSRPPHVLALCVVRYIIERQRLLILQGTPDIPGLLKAEVVRLLEASRRIDARKAGVSTVAQTQSAVDIVLDPAFDACQPCMQLESVCQLPLSTHSRNSSLDGNTWKIRDCILSVASIEKVTPAVLSIALQTATTDQARMEGKPAEFSAVVILAAASRFRMLDDSKLKTILARYEVAAEGFEEASARILRMLKENEKHETQQSERNDFFY